MKHMRWVVAILTALIMTGLAVSPVSAAEPITGTIVTETTPGYYDPVQDIWVVGTYAPLAGITVTAYGPMPDGSPGGKVLARTVTDATGTFSLTVDPGPVGIKVDAPAEWQSGWVYEAVTDPTYPYTGTYLTPPPSCLIMPGASLGSVVLLSAQASGRVVNLNGDPISGALVKYYPYDFSRRSFSDTTDADGWYTITGLDYEEMEVYVSAKKYLPGYVSSTGLVVPTSGEASNWGTGLIGTPDGEIVMTLR